MAFGAEQALLPGPEKKESKLLPWLGAMIGLSLLAGGAGGFLGLQLVAVTKQKLELATKTDSPPVDEKSAGGTNLQELPPIIANLADPSDTWVRLQASIVVDGASSDKPSEKSSEKGHDKGHDASSVLAAQIAEDSLGFIKTLSLAQIGGASGLQHLREDLNERAQIRSDGRVKELLIETLVVQ